MKNSVSLIGRVGTDVKITTLENGEASSFSLGTSETFKNKDGEKETKTTWHNIVAYGKTAELIKKYVEKGDLIDIEGKIQNRNYDDKDGIKRYISEIIVNKVIFLISKNQSKTEINENNQETENDQNE